jgi:SAM-dependent methyltransferase
MSSEWPVPVEDFAAYYAFTPAALALRETVRLAAVRTIDLPEPILDVGCGDGLFARLAYPGRQVWGIDINPHEVRRAQASQSYRTLIVGSVCDVDLPTGFFKSAIANCSLEHVPDLPAALRNIRRSMQPGAPFVLIVPTPDWSRHLAIPAALSRLGLHAIARAYGDALDKIFFHVHLHEEDWWRARLDEAGFTTEEVRPLVQRSTSWAFDLLLPPSLIGYVTKKLTGRWVLAPALRPFTADLVRRLITAVADQIPDDGRAGEYLIFTRAR